MARAILALSALLILACATAGSSKRDQLVGRWRSSVGAQTGEYVFSVDGTFSGYTAREGALLAKFTGKWSLRGDAILYEYTSDATGNIPVGTKDRDKLLSLAKDHYVIEAADGSRRKYVRID